MRHYDLHEDDVFLKIASDIWDFTHSYTPEEKEYFREKSYKEKESWEAYLWRMIPSIKYNKVWADYQELADNMSKNVVDHNKYYQIASHLKARK